MPALLMIDPNPANTESVRRLVSRSVRFCSEPSGAAGWNRVTTLTHAFCGVVIADDLCGETGATVAIRLRERFESLPLLVICTNADAGAINTLHAHRCEVIVQPFHSANILGFVDKACAQYRTTLVSRPRLGGADAGLSRREQQILACAYRGLSRAGIASELGIAESTVKTLTTRILRKLDIDGTLKDAALLFARTEEQRQRPWQIESSLPPH